MTDRMPALYIGHGAPPLLDDPVWSSQLSGLAAELPRPKAILIVSAHWESAPVMLSADGAPLVYDFGGFAERYYRMTYATPAGHRPGPAGRRDDAGRRAGPSALQPRARPRRLGAAEDHVPRRPTSRCSRCRCPPSDPTRLLALGERLRPLRDEGVLIIGSGFLTHGLPFLTEFRIDAAAPGWSQDFDTWAGEALARGDVDALASYQSQAPGMPYAHPTVEHYTPLFVTLGASSDPEVPGEQLFEGFWMGLSKRSLQVA